MWLGSYPPCSHSGTLTRFAGSNEVAAAAVRHTQSPGAAQPHEGRMPAGPQPRFAGERDLNAVKQTVDASSRAAQEQRIEAFREDYANLRSKGLSDEAAVAQAVWAQETGEHPAASLRYQMLSEG